MKLSDNAANIYSQSGEDGIIQRIFEQIGTTSKICVEFGAWDGFYLSNTANLWTNGWTGILIEADEQRYGELVKNTAPYPCHCIHALVGFDGENTLENILKREGIQQKIDLLSIDIDGDDYYIFASLKELRPRVILCEYNPTIPAQLDLLAPPQNRFGCSITALMKLAETKGYKLVATTKTNAVFVQEEDFPCFAAYETSLDALASTDNLTYLITSYDGLYVLSRQPTYGCQGPYRLPLNGEFFSFPSETTTSSSQPTRTTLRHKLKNAARRVWRRLRENSSEYRFHRLVWSAPPYAGQSLMGLSTYYHDVKARIKSKPSLVVYRGTNANGCLIDLFLKQFVLPIIHVFEPIPVRTLYGILVETPETQQIQT